MNLINKFECKKENAEKGATMIEYVLLAALIAVVCIVAIRSVGNEANNAFNTVQNSLNDANVRGAASTN